MLAIKILAIALLVMFLVIVALTIIAVFQCKDEPTKPNVVNDPTFSCWHDN